MDMLKKFFPFSFNVKEKDVTSLIVSIIIHLVAGLVVTLVMSLLGSLLGFIPVIGWLFGAIGSIVDLYCLIGILLAVLLFFNVLK